mmetsp:Transcript_67515/g.181688  ORF Transcript_67515/g.181688 Transcript_67515/m.181688 type:complete len:314 (+) Transcript_67515:395-1336(+)
MPPPCIGIPGGIRPDEPGGPCPWPWPWPCPCMGALLPGPKGAEPSKGTRASSLPAPASTSGEPAPAAASPLLEESEAFLFLSFFFLPFLFFFVLLLFLLALGLRAGVDDLLRPILVDGPREVILEEVRHELLVLVLVVRVGDSTIGAVVLVGLLPLLVMLQTLRQQLPQELLVLEVHGAPHDLLGDIHGLGRRLHALAHQGLGVGVPAQAELHHGARRTAARGRDPGRDLKGLPRNPGHGGRVHRAVAECSPHLRCSGGGRGSGSASGGGGVQKRDGRGAGRGPRREGRRGRRGQGHGRRCYRRRRRKQALLL